MKWLSLFIILSISLASLIVPELIPYDPYAINLSQSLQGPSLQHLFGLNEQGQDVLLKLIYGARLSLIICFLVLLFSLIIGLLLGTLSAFGGKIIDGIIMSLADMTLAFPKFLLALVLLAFMGPSLGNLIFALSFSTWAGIARLVRGEVKHIKEKEFVLNSVAFGSPVFWILNRHIWPQLLSLLVVHSTFTVAGILIAESGLNFLGIGVSSSAPSWGGLISSGRKYLMEAPHLSLFPGLILFLFLLSLNILGDLLRDYLNPREQV